MKCQFKLKKDYVVPDKDYVKVPNNMLRLGIPATEIVLIQFLMSQKDDFCLNKTFIQIGLNWDKNKVNRAIKGLIKKGYLIINDDEWTINLEGVQNVPVRNVPVQNVLVRNVPVQNVPVQNVPVQNVPVQNVPVQNVPVRNVPVQNVPLEGVQNEPIDGAKCTPIGYEMHPLKGTNRTTNNTIQDYKQNEETKLINKTKEKKEKKESFSPSKVFAKFTHPIVFSIWERFINDNPKYDNPKIYDKFNKVLFYIIFKYYDSKNRNEVSSNLSKFEEEDITTFSSSIIGVFEILKDDESILNEFKKIINTNYIEYKPKIN